jgi:hypothetical protein
MASYLVNERALEKARRLVESRQYVLNSNWGEVQPNAKAEHAYLASHSWAEYGEWHLGLTEGAPEETKARYAFVYGDFRRLHRTGLIACHYRAAEWRHKDIELAAHELLQLLDASSA